MRRGRVRGAVIAFTIVVVAQVESHLSGGPQTPGSQPADPWEVSDVAHGVVHRHLYKSQIGGDTRDLYVYTRPAMTRRPSDDTRFYTCFTASATTPARGPRWGWRI
jgi:hypothetical protein